MSLDVTLYARRTYERRSTGIFVRERGEIVEVSIEDWEYQNPGQSPTIQQSVSVDESVFTANITTNLAEMARRARVYDALWHPENIGAEKAKGIIEPLERGLARLRRMPEYFQRFDAPNGWGKYKNLVEFVERYLAACREYPDAKIHTSR